MAPLLLRLLLEAQTHRGSNHFDGTHGIYQRHRPTCSRAPGCGCGWWVRFHDESGHEHRKKVGPKKLALSVYQKLKTEVAERRFFPEKYKRRDVLLQDQIRDHLARNQARLRSLVNWQ